MKRRLEPLLVLVAVAVLFWLVSGRPQAPIVSPLDLSRVQGPPWTGSLQQWEELRKQGDSRLDADDLSGAESLWNMALDQALLLDPEVRHPNWGPRPYKQEAIVLVLEDLDDVYLARGKPEVAEAILLQSLEIRRTSRFANSRWYATPALTQLAQLCYGSGRIAEGDRYSEEALTLWEDMDERNFSQHLFGYAAQVRATGRSERAGELEARATEIAAGKRSPADWRGP